MAGAGLRNEDIGLSDSGCSAGEADESIESRLAAAPARSADDESGSADDDTDDAEADANAERNEEAGFAGVCGDAPPSRNAAVRWRFATELSSKPRSEAESSNTSS